MLVVDIMEAIFVRGRHSCKSKLWKGICTQLFTQTDILEPTGEQWFLVCNRAPYLTLPHTLPIFVKIDILMMDGGIKIAINQFWGVCTQNNRLRRLLNFLH